jgi:hypothetical protein
MERYEYSIYEYAHKRQPRWGVRMKNPVTENMLQEPGFKTREAAREWLDNVLRNGSAHLDAHYQGPR